MKVKCLTLILAFCLNVSILLSQDRFCVIEYNVENLFDCRHDSLKQDTEFLPESIRGWNFFRFKEKVERIAKVIYAAGVDDVPALVGLCEVENDFCIQSLVRFSSLKEVGYRYVMTESPDLRGIDVALLYQPQRFKLSATERVRVEYPDAKRPTRDLLHVTGRVAAGDTIDVFVCHMPSRTGGRKVSEPYRVFTATLLKQQVEAVMRQRTAPNIIVMGDFNDYPDNYPICGVLGAKKPDGAVDGNHLYNLMDGKKGGTYKYKGEWGILDHMIVNGRLLDENNRLHTSYEAAEILNFPFLLEEDEKTGGMKPFRTYNGMRYNGGYSDHLPIRMVLKE